MLKKTLHILPRLNSEQRVIFEDRYNRSFVEIYKTLCDKKSKNKKDFNIFKEQLKNLPC